MLGDLPPSSNVTALMLVLEDASSTLRPVMVLPVNATLLMSGWSMIAWPTVLP